jgi:hypothetical protein
MTLQEMMIMEVKRLLQVSGWAAVLAGLLLTGAEITLTFFVGGDVTTLSFASRLSSALFLSGAVALVVGAVGMYLVQADQAGKLGLIAFVIALMGSALMVASDWNEFFVMPVLVADGYTQAPEGLIPGFILNFFTYAIGWTLFAVATFRAKVLPRPAAVMVAVGHVLTLTGLPAVYLPTYLATVWIGVVILQKQRASVPQVAPVAVHSEGVV